jgi:type IV secretory pathway TrbF-like protein
MKEYYFTSPQFDGYMLFAYDQQGCIIKFEQNALLTDEQYRYLTAHFPFDEADLQKIQGSTGKIVESTDLSFERFWREYNHKKDKASAERYWTKMSDIEKAKALAGVKRYRYDCIKHNRDMVYAIRYLKNRRYMDE